MVAASSLQQVTALVAQLGGLAILAGTLAAVAAFAYRWYAREAVPRGLPLLVGLSGVAIYLNTTTALGQVIGGTAEPTGVEEALFNIAAFAVGAAGAELGRRVGDRFGTDVFLTGGFGEIEDDVGQFVRSVGRVIGVELPEEIEDVVGYDPVPEETKADLAGKRFLFPRRLTREELRDRLVARLKADYAVGHVDVELTDDGTVEYLALGSRAAGIGPTLPPATNAVAIRADPAFAASAGDLVQVWETDPMRRVLTAELRGVAGDTVTIAIDAADTPKIDPRTEYRLVTLPVTDRPDREFASLLRAADETFSSVSVDPGSPAHGMPVGALDLTVVSVKPESGEPVVLPAPEYVLAPGDVVFAIARPEALRRLEEAARPLDPSLVRTVGTSSRPPEDDQPRQPGGTGPAESGSVPDQPADAGPEEPREKPEVGADPETKPEPEPEPESADERARDAPDATPSAPPEESTDAEPTDDKATETPAANAEGSPEDDELGDRADMQSFQELKDEFESGEAEWAGDTGAAGAEPADGEDPAPPSEQEADDADDATAAEEGIEFGEDLDDGDGLFEEDSADDLEGLDLEDDEGDGLEGLDLEDEDDEDDLVALDFDEEADDSGFELEGGPEADEDEDDDGKEGSDDEDESEDGDDDDDDDGENGDGGGASSFQQLKEEFESGDADWADDIDSPGGDMRLDE